jgi:hypothetical protein
MTISNMLHRLHFLVIPAKAGIHGAILEAGAAEDAHELGKATGLPQSWAAPIGRGPAASGRGA